LYLTCQLHQQKSASGVKTLMLACSKELFNIT
jgi:hypothetical protein